MVQRCWPLENEWARWISCKLIAQVQKGSHQNNRLDRHYIPCQLVGPIVSKRGDDGNAFAIKKRASRKYQKINDTYNAAWRRTERAIGKATGEKAIFHGNASNISRDWSRSVWCVCWAWRRIWRTRWTVDRCSRRPAVGRPVGRSCPCYTLRLPDAYHNEKAKVQRNS
jgi:hypothetical protein